MRHDSQPHRAEGSAGVSQTVTSSADSRERSGLEQRFWAAMALYAVLAALAWFTLGEGAVFVAGKPVELRLVPLIIIGGLALRTVLARQADRIRRDGREGQ
jgi:hypothetical protein